MIVKKLSLSAKLSLLIKIWLAKFGLIHLILTAKRIPLNEHGKTKLNEVEKLWLGNIEYKRIADSTGEWRFYIPALDEDAVWRIDECYSLKKKPALPPTLDFIVNRDGIRDEKRYKEVWQQGKSY